MTRFRPFAASVAMSAVAFASSVMSCPDDVQPVGRVRKPLYGCGEHVVVFPAFVPSTLTLTYAGIRVGAVLESVDYRPFQVFPDKVEQVTGTGAVDVEKLITRDFAIRATAIG